MCVLDQLTGGRLDFGVGRGAVPIEHYWFGQRLAGVPGPVHDVLGIIQRALATGEISSEGSRFFDFPTDPDVDQAAPGPHPVLVSGSPADRRAPWDEPDVARQDRRGLLRAVRQDVARPQGDDSGSTDRSSEPRVGYSMLLSIAPTEDEALDIARRGMEGLVRRTRNAHRFDHLILPRRSATPPRARCERSRQHGGRHPGGGRNPRDRSPSVWPICSTTA